MNENQIEEVREEALRGCVLLRVLDLSHNLLHEQDIAIRAWIYLKYVHSSTHPEQFIKIIFCSSSISHKGVDWCCLGI